MYKFIIYLYNIDDINSDIRLNSITEILIAISY